MLAVALAVAAAAIAPPPANARFDYQIGEPYKPPRGVRVVSRDWFDAKPPKRGYAICYVNAFQTQDDSPDVVRPDERSAWPADLVLSSLADDPNWGGEFLVGISTAAKRRRAADWLQPMIETCKRKGFDAVEYDNLDSWTRFDGTVRALSRVQRLPARLRQPRDRDRVPAPRLPLHLPDRRPPHLGRAPGRRRERARIADLPLRLVLMSISLWPDRRPE